MINYKFLRKKIEYFKKVLCFYKDKKISKRIKFNFANSKLI